jgi:hypothetical protein
MVDLHLHTTASDGMLEPRALVERAKQSRLHTICITDHDTVGGFAAAWAAGAELGIEVLPGCEVSCDQNGKEIHVLGLLVNPLDPTFVARLDGFREERRLHLPRILARLAELGVPVTEAEVRRYASKEFVGRPHIARAMIARGYVSHLDEAFDRFLGTDAPAYVPRRRISAAEAIELIRLAGGVPVVAHPGVYGFEDRHIAELQELGLAGVEVMHPDHDEPLRTRYAEIARRRNLLLTGGSDFHGTDRWKSRVQPGAMSVPDSFLDAVRALSRFPRGVEPVLAPAAP